MRKPGGDFYLKKRILFGSLADPFCLETDPFFAESDPSGRETDPIGPAWPPVRENWLSKSANGGHSPPYIYVRWCAAEMLAANRMALAGVKRREDFLFLQFRRLRGRERAAYPLVGVVRRADPMESGALVFADYAEAHEGGVAEPALALGFDRVFCLPCGLEGFAGR